MLGLRNLSIVTAVVVFGTCVASPQSVQEIDGNALESTVETSDKFVDTQLFGVIVGSIIAGVFTVVAQILSNLRQNKLFVHNLKVTQMQLYHEREQQIRDRKTAALSDLEVMMEEQAAALRDLWGFIRNPVLRHHLSISPDNAWKILNERGYRRKLWPISGSLSESINKYAHETEKMLLFIRQQKEIPSFWTDDSPVLDEHLKVGVDSKFQAAADSLSTAIKGVITLMSELNDIEIQKSS